MDILCPIGSQLERNVMKTTQFKLILPADVKAWLEAEAKKNLRSQGAQIVTCLRIEMTKDAEPQSS